jgi:NAD+ synthase
MPESLLLALAQLNPIMGDIAGNSVKLQAARQVAAEQGAHLLMTSELYLCGYPPEDLVLKPTFQLAIQDAVQALAKETSDGGPALLLGAPWRQGENLHNTMLLLKEGQIAATIFKHDLPNYGPFDEKRVFKPGALPEPIVFRGHKLGVMICEDMWTEKAAANLKLRAAEILLVPNGSPYETNKLMERTKVARLRVAETKLPLAYLNQVGGQDELVFDGASFILNSAGGCVYQGICWDEDTFLLPVDQLNKLAAITEEKPDQDAAVYHALMLGLKDYVTKNGFPGVVLGLSGGIDSAFAITLAVDALGAERVWGVMMPSPYTSRDSVEDAEALAQNLGCRYESISIAPMMQSFDAALHDVFIDTEADVTEENIQARCRGIILMGLSNKFGPMVLSTGNKSEMSVGYSTLYGDLCGGYAVLKDVYKNQVYSAARWRNTNKPAGGLGPDGVIIPDRVLIKAPTAELRPNQKDQDSLPPYDVLDDILECLIEQDLGVSEIVARGHDATVVKRVWSMLDHAEYKRRQAPPGVKITRRLLGKDRRYPITNRYKDRYKKSV